MKKERCETCEFYKWKYQDMKRDKEKFKKKLSNLRDFIKVKLNKEVIPNSKNKFKWIIKND